MPEAIPSGNGSHGHAPAITQLRRMGLVQAGRPHEFHEVIRLKVRQGERKREAPVIDQALGRCHAVWERQARILREEHFVRWYSPAQMNPLTDFADFSAPQCLLKTTRIVRMSSSLPTPQKSGGPETKAPGDALRAHPAEDAVRSPKQKAPHEAGL